MIRDIEVIIHVHRETVGTSNSLRHAQGIRYIDVWGSDVWLYLYEHRQARVYVIVLVWFEEKNRNTSFRGKLQRTHEYAGHLGI